jgi:hypothetical protein
MKSGIKVLVGTAGADRRLGHIPNNILGMTSSFFEFWDAQCGLVGDGQVMVLSGGYSRMGWQ